MFICECSTCVWIKRVHIKLQLFSNSLINIIRHFYIKVPSLETWDWQSSEDCCENKMYNIHKKALTDQKKFQNPNFFGWLYVLLLTGLKPQKGFWTQWKLKDLTTTTIHGTRKPPGKVLYERILRSQERIMNSK